MISWKQQIEDCLRDVPAMSLLAHAPLNPGTLAVEFWPAPHARPKNLPKGRMAVYAFWGDGEWLKVGIAGPKTIARYTSQHYNGQAPSTLAASLCASSRMRSVEDFDVRNPAAWIQGRCHRVNILLPAELGRPLLVLLEAFFHLRLKPRHEGRIKL